MNAIFWRRYLSKFDAIGADFVPVGGRANLYVSCYFAACFGIIPSLEIRLASFAQRTDWKLFDYNKQLAVLSMGLLKIKQFCPLLAAKFSFVGVVTIR